jgi:hypothetical protein
VEGVQGYKDESKGDSLSASMSWLLRLIEGNAKCRHLKKLTCEGILWQVFICLRPRTPYPPPLTHCVRVIQYTYSQRKGAREESNQKEG